MTNYTYLDKKGILDKFLYRCFEQKVFDLKDFGGSGLLAPTVPNIIAWLRAEHKEKVKYVKLDDVLTLVASSNCYLAERGADGNYFGWFSISKKISELPTKELEE